MKLLVVSLSIQLASSYWMPSTSSSITELGSRNIHDVDVQMKMSESAMEPEQPFQMKSKTKMSEAIPFLKCPSYLNGELAGDVGFDPLGFGKNRDVVLEMREAEIKHARLAMLAAVGWPLSELFDKQIASYFDVTPVLDATDRAPSLLNGGLEKIVPEWWGFCLGLTGAIDLYGVQRARSPVDENTDSSEEKYFPGNLGFDPLGLYPLDKEGRQRMQLCEIKHGRVAMLAVVGYAVQEALLKVGVVDETPIFFKPLF